MSSNYEVGHVERVVPGVIGMENLVEASLAKYRFASKLCKEKKVLDAGCGCGQGSELLFLKGARRVVGIDNSFEALEFARNHCKSLAVDFLRMDCESLLAFKDKSFDMVTCFEVIEHLLNRDHFLAEVRRVLKRDGVLVMSTPNRETTSGGEANPYHVKDYSLRELREELGRYFSEVKIFGMEFDHPEARKYERASKDLERVSWLSSSLPMISKFVPKVFKDWFFRRLTPDFPSLSEEEIKICTYDPRTRVLVGVCRN